MLAFVSSGVVYVSGLNLISPATVDDVLLGLSEVWFYRIFYQGFSCVEGMMYLN